MQKRVSERQIEGQIEVSSGRRHEWTSSCPRCRVSRWDRREIGAGEGAVFQDGRSLQCRRKRRALEIQFSVLFGAWLS